MDIVSAPQQYHGHNHEACYKKENATYDDCGHWRRQRHVFTPVLRLTASNAMQFSLALAPCEVKRGGHCQWTSSKAWPEMCPSCADFMDVTKPLQEGGPYRQHVAAAQGLAPLREVGRC